MAIGRDLQVGNAIVGAYREMGGADGVRHSSTGIAERFRCLSRKRGRCLVHKTPRRSIRGASMLVNWVTSEMYSIDSPDTDHTKIDAPRYVH